MPTSVANTLMICRQFMQYFTPATFISEVRCCSAFGGGEVSWPALSLCLRMKSLSLCERSFVPLSRVAREIKFSSVRLVRGHWGKVERKVFASGLVGDLGVRLDAVAD